MRIDHPCRGPRDWGTPRTGTWAATGGAYAVNAVTFLAEGRPWSVIVLMALALALFMTRLKY